MSEPAAPLERVRPSRSVRFRLLAIALLPMLVIVPLVAGGIMLRWNTKFSEVLINKVSADLTIARQYLARLMETNGERLTAIAQSARFQSAASGPALADLLAQEKTALGLDYLYLSDASGALIAASSPDLRLPQQSSPVIASALEGTARTGITILSGPDLERLSQDLAARARLDIVPTANAAPSPRKTEDRGMVILAATPVTLADGRKAALTGGLLLNQNLVFIDTINDLVYRQGSLPEGSEGTATLFLDDVRISTNVRLFEGKRALGTRVSDAVRKTVLDDGITWRASAFVVNDWYISAYEPILDSEGQRAGMLYVGFLETPFTQARQQTVLLVVLALLAIGTITVPIFLRWARAIFRPLEKMAGTISRVEAGDMGARTHAPQPQGGGAGQDEITRVAHLLDHLLDLVQERDAALRQWNEQLNARVAERTRELEQSNLQLEAATRQLIVSEKLAAIGEITAGVAHEINNPVAVIQGNLDVLRQVMGDRAVEAATEFRLLDEQVHRIHLIVTRLLQFARPEEFAGWTERTDPAEALEGCLPLVQHLLKKAGVSVTLEPFSTRQVLINRTELQQVLINLIVNAVHAMPGGGRLRLACEDAEEAGLSGVRFTVADTGTGMSAEVQARIFEPFFTTRPAPGTTPGSSSTSGSSATGSGLGLSICQKLVERQNGRITVQSTPGEGTTFTIFLPEAA
ncbi:sensor histidine kinase [Pannonibacter phragmitetus]|uniref:sensor histidine kinase n=1 Tax=Pannonibacter phragmitetus TaxID=121719 RepID=UPI000F449B33|nr:cache domain-containing protein [Pannonibacter phragmitetus]MBA4207128.1 two-component sensor histidine kinase [Polymorphum sp.]